MGQLIFPLSPKEAKDKEITYSSRDNREAIFPTRLREERALKGVSQDEFSKEIGVTKSTISLYETGENVPDIKTLVKIADYFDINCNYLLGKTNIRKKDADIQTIGDYTGLNEKTIIKLHQWNKSKDKYDFLNSDIDFINAFLSAEEVSTLFGEISGYIESVEYCIFLEAKYHEFIDFSSADVPNEDNISEFENIRRKKIFAQYKEKEKAQRFHLFNISTIFNDFMKVYKNSIENKFDLCKYWEENADKMPYYINPL